MTTDATETKGIIRDHYAQLHANFLLNIYFWWSFFVSDQQEKDSFAITSFLKKPSTAQLLTVWNSFKKKIML